MVRGIKIVKFIALPPWGLIGRTRYEKGTVFRNVLLLFHICGLTNLTHGHNVCEVGYAINNV